MKPSSYQMALGYLFLLCLFSLLVVIVISLFVTHTEQPAIDGMFLILFVLSIGLVGGGCLQVRVARKQGLLKYWYQQLEILIGLILFCFMMIFITVSIFDALFLAYHLRVVYYLEIATLFLWILLTLFCLSFVIKYNIEEKKKL